MSHTDEISKYKPQLLWPVPIWEIDLDIPQGFNRELESEIRQILNAKSGPSFNLFDHEQPNIKQLKTLVLSAVQMAIDAADLPYEAPRLRSASVLTQKHGDWDTPHHHIHVPLAGVYYVNIPDGAGDLLLIDPYPSSIYWPNFEGSKFGRTFKRITPKEGKLVLFPGSLQHMVAPLNADGKYRTSIALNFMLQGKGGNK